jgi:hypothetical protein
VKITASIFSGLDFFFLKWLAAVGFALALLINYSLHIKAHYHDKFNIVFYIYLHL